MTMDIRKKITTIELHKYNRTAVYVPDIVTYVLVRHNGSCPAGYRYHAVWRYRV